MRTIYSPSSRPRWQVEQNLERLQPAPPPEPDLWESFRELHISRFFGSPKSNQRIYFGWEVYRCIRRHISGTDRVPSDQVRVPDLPYPSAGRLLFRSTASPR